MHFVMLMLVAVYIMKVCPGVGVGDLSGLYRWLRYHLRDVVLRLVAFKMV